MVWVTTPYRGPKQSKRQKRRGQEGSGIYPELAVLGIREGSSPALLELVGRMAALLPSFEITRKELQAQGLPLDIKVVHRLAKQLGAELLTLRSRDLELYRAGALPRGTALAGKRVGVAVDGGRVRLRTVIRKQKGKGKGKKQRRKMRVEWREPKVLIIFEMDRHGRMVRDSRPWMDATFDGPDVAMELLAMHLHRLGAAAARLVTFVSDGAPWIWERVSLVANHVGISDKRVVFVLDWCHAMHHVGLALKQLSLEETEQRRVYRKYRKWLRLGKVSAVVTDLKRRAVTIKDDDEWQTELRYLEKHASAGHMDYDVFRRRGAPLGSGAIESAIRRVVNLRLKGNGLLWLEDNAEGMLQLRATVLAGRWEEMQAKVRRRFASNRHIQLKAGGSAIVWKTQPEDDESVAKPAA